MKCDEVTKELATPGDHRDSTALAGHLAGCSACARWANRAVQLDRLWEATRPPEPTPDVWDAVWARMTASLDPSTSTELKLNGSPSAVETPRKNFGQLPRPRPWPLATIGLIGLAQAAAILLAVGLAWYQSKPSQVPHGPEIADLTSTSSNTDTMIRIAIPEEGFPVVADEGHTVVIHWDRQEHKLSFPVFLTNFSMLVMQADGQAPKVVDQTPRKVLAHKQWWKKTPEPMDQELERGAVFGVDELYLMYNQFESMTSPSVAMKE